MSATHLKKVAIIGATGTLARQIIAHTAPWQQITAICRDTSSDSSIPKQPNVTIARVPSYEDVDAVAGVLAQHDAAVLALSGAALGAISSAVIKAAGRAGVPWIFPSEFGSDTASESAVKAVPILKHKVNARKEVEALGMSWVGVATNGWFDFALRGSFGGFGINVAEKKARILDGGDIKTYVSTVPFSGLAVAKVLALPLQGEVSLESYRNKMVYVASHQVTQREMLRAVQRVVGSEGWNVSEESVDSYMQEGRDRMAAGDFYGVVNLIYGIHFQPGVGAGFSGPLANEALDLPKEDFEAMVESVLREEQAK